MTSTDSTLRGTTEALDIELDAALDPGETEGVYRDTRESLALALIGGAGGLLLSPPTPRPKKG
ncbi:hypothetical protein [Streptomyces sp. H27-C3]|uniref:hypothetical protein n=1 Tax=Streptomyces sp. H27-C3 TaxID=3046305 RepID=UPI0024BBD2D9|nr:hypothetical protein [Streptomyces sp. H27-C3]MDJ0467079.1 hypothetical protein [Streptomyces sp. H27-C3]MDJ0467080.1 hypothetical protein [Streptomyces sp. H27-C3]